MEWRERSHYKMLKWIVRCMGMLGAALTALTLLQLMPNPVTQRVGVVGALPGDVSALLNAPAQLRVEFVAEPDRASAEAGVRSGRLGAAVIEGTVVARSQPASTLVVVLRRALPRAELAERLQSAGVERDEALAIGALPAAPVAVLAAPSENRKANVGVARVGASAGGGLVFFLAQFIASGVQEERGRRMADVLLVPLTALEVIAGKVLGVELLGLAVFARVAMLPSLVALGLGGAHLVGQVLWTLLAVAFWFVLNLAFYGCVAAMAGAKSPSPEEAGLASLPGAMAVGLAASSATALVAFSPDGTASTFGSFFPLTAAPFTLVRAAAGTVAAWEVVVAALVVLVSIAALARVASWFYVAGVVLAGDELTLRKVFRAQFNRRSRRRVESAGAGGQAGLPGPDGGTPPDAVAPAAGTASQGPGRP